MVLIMKQNKISGVYKITNTITGDFYIGSSKNIKKRWVSHKSPSNWTRYPNIKLYQAIIQFGLNNFKFEILEETDNLREREQVWIDQLNPSYNNTRANGFDIKRYKDYQKEYYNSNRNTYLNKKKGYYKAHCDERLTKSKEYCKSHHDEQLAKSKEYYNRICLYEGHILTLRALSHRLRRKGISHPTQEAKKYLLTE